MGDLARAYDRRERVAQRDAIEQVLPQANEVSLLRTQSGEVLVYEEQSDKRRPVRLRAVVLPGGETVEVEQDRFAR